MQSIVFRITAIILLAVFYGTYIAKEMHQRKQGIKTNQLGKGKTGLARFIELALKLMSYAILIAELISICLNTSLAPMPVRIVGILLGIAGNAVFIAAILTMRDSWRAGVSQSDKTELVTSGIYSYSRNPAFLGFDLLYIGIMLMFFNWWLFGITVLTIIVFHIQIVNVEESFLLSAFGDNYLAYKKSVNRYFGRRR